jgi:hypothetical protein
MAFTLLGETSLIVSLGAKKRGLNIASSHPDSNVMWASSQISTLPVETLVPT